MTETNFELVLEELRQLMLDLGDLAAHVYLVGGQALALESMTAGGDGRIAVTTATGITIDRGFSLEPDLLLDVENMGARADAVVDVLRDRRWRRIRDYRWAKDLAIGTMLLDLFRPEDTQAEDAPTGTTPLAESAVILGRPSQISVHAVGGELRIAVPDPAGFLASKLAAKSLRPDATKDCFDIFVYVQIKGPVFVRQSLLARSDGQRIIDDLRRFFGSVDSAGVRDVVAYAAGLGREEQDLLARSVVDALVQVTQ